MNRLLQPAALGFALLLNACTTVGPDYAGPPVVGHSGSFAGGEGQQGAPPVDQWWQQLECPELNDLIARALANQQDLGIAAQRLREARALRRQAAAALLPRAGANASFARLNAGNITGAGGGGSALGALAGAGGALLDDPLEYWGSGIDVAWEIDVFGGRRRQVRGATARAQAAEEALNGLRQGLVAEIAETYFTIAGLRAQLTAANAQVTLQQAQADDMRTRVEAGAASRLALDRSRARLETTRSQIPELESGILTQHKRLALLLGDRPDALDDRGIAAWALPDSLPMARTGLPAQLVLRRPDLRQAERELAAATEDVGAAVASFYPTFTIGGGPSGFGAEPADLFNAAGYIWQLSPRVEWSLFEGGANRAALAGADARRKAALLAYEKAVLRAIGEVETELAILRGETEKLAIIQRARAAAGDAVRRVRENHAAGATDLIDVLVEEETLRTIEITEIRVKNQMLQIWIRLHKALGGGWE